MREVVTLQLGQLSNYVATHFWNTQESYFTYSATEQSLVDHDVHWRAGTGSDGGETFLPRTVIYDLKGGFGSLKKINALYDVQPDSGNVMENALWPGKPSVLRQEPLQQSAYIQSLDVGSTPPEKLSKSNVRYWSDFSRVYYHPKSHNQLYDYELDSSIRPFERFDMGTELFQTLNKEQEIVDRDWRPFVEECDHMQGIQVITSIDDAWGGFASRYVECLRDEYPKQCIWVWGCQSPMLDASRERRRLRLANMAQSTNEICQQATTFIPMSVPERRRLPSTVKLDCCSTWQTSALLAAALESASLPSRLLPQSGSTQRVSLDEISQFVNAHGSQTLAGMRLGLGSNGATSDQKEEEEEEEAAAADEEEEEEQFEIDLFGFGRTKINDHRLDQKKRVFGKFISSRGQKPKHAAEEQGSEEESWRRRRRRRRPKGNPIVKRFATTVEFPMIDSYPEIFPDAVGHDSIPLRTALFTDQSISARIKALKTQVTSAIGIEQRENLLNSLADIGDAYHEDWSSQSDDGED